MDQESFRKLLETPHPASSGAAAHKPKLKGSTSQLAAVDAAQPTFKPRKVKKQSDSSYRDRAAERRLGIASDYAGVEAVLENFEKRTADNEDREAVEEQRRYLGGDSEHSILVKGLDYALLEQNKARAAAATEDDEVLEDTFLAVAAPAVPQKRTRADLLRELKEKRLGAATSTTEAKTNGTAAVEDVDIEEAKKAGKFKPIGFKPILEPAGKSRKREDKDKDKGAERKKKKRKVAEKPGETAVLHGQQEEGGTGKVLESKASLPSAPSELAAGPSTARTKEKAPEPQSLDEVVDIFAGAGEYEGIDFDEDEDEEVVQPPADEMLSEPEQPRQWFVDEEPPPKSPSPPPTSNPQTRSPGHEREEGERQEDDGESEQPVRLVPLASSALPSIKDILAMDEALDAEQKRKGRKEKRKGGVGGEGGGGGEGKKKKSTEAKINRDYQKLKSYTDKKAGG